MICQRSDDLQPLFLHPASTSIVTALMVFKYHLLLSHFVQIMLVILVSVTLNPLHEVPFTIHK